MKTHSRKGSSGKSSKFQELPNLTSGKKKSVSKLPIMAQSQNIKKNILEMHKAIDR